MCNHIHRIIRDDMSEEYLDCGLKVPGPHWLDRPIGDAMMTLILSGLALLMAVLCLLKGGGG